MQHNPKQKSSINVTLALMGTMALGCGQSGRRSLYASQSDCTAEWGSGAGLCEAVSSGDANYSSGRYYGPFIADGSDTTSTGVRRATTTSRAISTTSVTRGGFGSSSSLHSSGS